MLFKAPPPGSGSGSGLLGLGHWLLCGLDSLGMPAKIAATQLFLSAPKHPKPRYLFTRMISKHNDLTDPLDQLESNQCPGHKCLQPGTLKSPVPSTN